MQKVVRRYLTLTKPGIIGGNGLTAVAGFFLASTTIDVGLLLVMLTGLSLIIGSGCVFNNCIDRIADAKMARTQNRPLALGLISLRRALVFGVVLGLLGMAVLAFTTKLALMVATTGFFVYVVMYTLMKYRTCYATLIGGIAGAIPPIVGYTAADPHLDGGAFLLFVMMFFWQMPHFFAIAIYRMKEYAAAQIPVFPIQKGMVATKREMLLYTLGFSLAAVSLTFFGYTGYLYLATAILLSVIWIGLSLNGFKATNDIRWARQMFIFSLITISLLSLTMMYAY